MATSAATPDDTPDDTPNGPSDAFADPVAEAISAIIDPLIENEKALAGCYAERVRLLAELDRLGHQPRILAGLCGDPIESGRNDPDTAAHGPSWDDEELARRTMAAEAGAALRLRANTAGGMVFDATRLNDGLPAFHAALTDGRITWGHALKMLELTVNLPDEVLPRFEAAVLGAAETRTSTQFAKVAVKVRERMHPTTLQERAEVGFAARRVVLRPDADGMAWLNAYLKADEAQAAYARLSRIAVDLDTDDAAAVGIAGAIPGAIPEGGTSATSATSGGPRTKDQRRADAYRDLLLDGIGPGGLGHGIRGTVHITVPALTLLDRSDEPAILDGYGPIDAETARRIAGTATSWTRILTHPETGCRLSVGTEQHAPPADMRRYLQIRDETCQGIGCTQRATLSEIDHTQAWNTGGETTVNNLVHLCKACHRLKHQSSFSTSQGPNGVLTWTSPGGKKYTSKAATELVEPRVEPDPDPTPTQRAGMAEKSRPVSDGPPPF
jgi:5-methylcytosine-specific restriction endonuclease McrA